MSTRPADKMHQIGRQLRSDRIYPLPAVTVVTQVDPGVSTPQITKQQYTQVVGDRRCHSISGTLAL